ncbi:gastrula zinc finger protein XlCGF57.1-like [Bicyclus anynana]|uniref:Gastrula zinc finger protein XlCGF57.1-like n=1 Tax=Bicyclus anynana TaxID=110368 RepID=A0A6J1NQK1_BICAN|nr:gastrula zinc finger protein XlCGF57.1-like [Bicyclus anynana]
MNDVTKRYCRLCAELRPIVQMMSPDKEVVDSSKIITKLSWINIDISTRNGLPNTICYACLELLERTWSFLNNVRTAQEKLQAIFLSKTNENVLEVEVEKKTYEQELPGKPVDENWEIFQELKREIKIENLNENVPTLFPSNTVVISHENQVSIKLETDSDGRDIIIDSNDDYDRLSSSDSDVPLKNCLKQKKSRKHKKSKNQSDSQPIPVNVSWDDQPCICAKCDIRCQNVTILQLHSLQIHDSCCVYKCTQCSKVLPGFRSFIRHMRTHNKELRHCCEFCNWTFSLSDLSSHKMKYHKLIYNTKCYQCGSNFDSPEELEEHKNLFNKRGNLKKVLKMDEPKVHKCDKCGKEFKSRANLCQHKYTHLDRTKDFACHVCGKMFFTKGALCTHLVVHEDKRPFKCNHCPLAFRAKGNLISHMSLHSGLKPFICEQCGKSFRVKRHLMSHSIVHTDLRPYVCEYCNKSFRFKTRLNLHLRQHTGVRPYRCIYCQRDFTNGSNYKKHMKRRHGIDTSTRLLSKLANKKELDAVSEAVPQ